MSVSEKIKQSVASKDIRAVRDGLWSCIVLDPNLTKSFADCWAYCKDNGISEDELYEKHDNRPMSDEISDENFSQLCGQLSTNFSKERLDKIKEIGRKLYPLEEDKSPRKEESLVDMIQEKKEIICGAVAGAVIGRVAGGVVGGVIGGVVGGVVGASIGSAINKK